MPRVRNRSARWQGTWHRWTRLPPTSRPVSRKLLVGGTTAPPRLAHRQRRSMDLLRPLLHSMHRWALLHRADSIRSRTQHRLRRRWPRCRRHIGRR
eukprot:scaffold1724_cov341-Pavlova_lutheri.AAC.30